jgi:hypothetical protein
VTKADPIVTATGNTCTYNGSPCAGSGSAKGVFGEDLTPMTVAYATTPAPGNLLTSAPSAAGTYSVAARYAGDSNYNPKQSAAATITINKAAASVTPDAKTKTYGSGDPALTGTLTGFVAADGITATYSRTVGENVAGSPYTISATLSPATALVNYDITYNTASFTITKADPIVTATGNTCTYNGSPCPGSGSAKGVLGEDLTPVTVAYATTPAPGNLLTSAPSAAGTYSVAVRYAGDVNYNGKQSAPATITINKKSASVTPDAKTKTYGSADPALTGTLSGFVASDGVTASYSRTAGETVAGSPYTISASLTPVAVLANYDITYNTANFTITKADPIVTVTGNTCTYDGTPCAGSGLAKGVLGEDLTPVTLAYAVTPGPGNLLTSAPVSAGTYSVAARYAGDANYNAKQSAPATITINAAPVTVNINGGPFTYDGNSHAATIVLTPAIAGYSVNYSGATTGYNSSTPPTNADTYTVAVTITDSNYVLSGSGTGSITINKTDPTVTAIGNTCTYDGNPCAGSGSAIPVNGENLTPVTLAYKDAQGNLLTSAPVNAGTYQVAARFAGNANYNQKQSAPATITINQASATLSITGGPFMYDGTAKAAMVTTSPAGLSGVSASYSQGGVAVTSPTNAGSYDVLAKLTNPNYQVSDVTGTLVINKAAATVTLSNLSQTYDGTPKTTTATTSPSGLTVLLTYNGSSTAPTNAGSYAAVGTVNDPNYQGSATGTLVIGKATPVFSNLSNPTIILGTPSATVSGKLSLGSLVPTGSVSVTLAGITQLTAIQGDGTFATTFATSGLDAGTYPNTFNYGGDSNFNGQTATSDSVRVMYKPVGTMCLSDAGHAILQPVNTDNTSVFKKGSTVPAKFRVCNVNAASVGTAGVVKDFKLTSMGSGTVPNTLETVESTTPDTAFRWDPTAQQWIFNISTKNLSANMTYGYTITLKDDSTVTLQFGLK